MVCPTNMVPEATAETVRVLIFEAVAMAPVNDAFVTGTPENGEASVAVAGAGSPNIAGAPEILSSLLSDHVKVKVIPDACTFMLGRARPPLAAGS